MNIMNKHVLLYVVVFFIYQSILYPQSAMVNKDIIKYTEIPQENIFVHHNTSLLFTGEYLYYRVYCINSKVNNLSDISKIAYLELIGEDKKTVFKHKIRLENGLGQGDFFVPVNIESGNYKLIGYTEWMKNVKGDHFFQSDISIINPYQSNQKSIRAEVNELGEYITNIQIAQKEKKGEASSRNTVTGLVLMTSQKKFTKREKVSLQLKKTGNTAMSGNYSLSVRKEDTIETPTMHTTGTYSSLFKNGNTKRKTGDSKINIPELRGALISGKVTVKKSGVVAANKKVAISIPGKEYGLKIATTNEEGIFYFNVDKEYIETNAFVQVLGNKEQYRITLNKAISPDYTNLKFNKFKITPAMKDMIVERSVYNQIRNGYFSVKPDTLEPVKKIHPFYEKKGMVYNLDDYTRFPTIRETLIEIVDNAWIKKNKNGEYTFQVRAYNPTYDDYGILPLVIIDGVLLQDHDDIVEYNAKKVQKIHLLRDRYFLGSQIFQGVIDIETIDGEYYTSIMKEGVFTIELPKPLPVKRYYREHYNEISKSTTDHIPDFRHQLLWMPNIKLNEEEMTIDFFTSDNTGNYEICLEGFTKEGKPISIKETILVE